MAATDRRALERYHSRVRGCLLGGAIGDALGGAIEFRSLAQIRSAHPDGVRDFVAGGEGWPAGTITDDTQLTLFTVEGIIRACVREDRGIGFTVGVIHHAYERWLQTQTRRAPSGAHDGWLVGEQWLYARRAPGQTCLSALTEMTRSYRPVADNSSKGCGAVMRSAPFGLLRDWPAQHVLDVAAEAAAVTHGHSTGQLAAGALALMIRHLVDDADLEGALEETLAELSRREGHQECTSALRRARELAACGPGTAEQLESLGGGWVAEEALAIAVYAALAFPGPDDMLDALSLAVTHSGDSDSTGSICGNLLGALHGETALPAELLFRVEGRTVITRLADDLALELTRGYRLHGDYGPVTAWTEHYPGW